MTLYHDQLCLLVFILIIVNSKFREEFYTLRTLEAHLQHCSLVEGDSTGRLSTQYGVNHRSTLLGTYKTLICAVVLYFLM